MKFKLKENRKEIITDTLTPVSIYLKIRDIYANSILLESSDYSSKDNSYAYICFKPIAKFELENNYLEINYPNKERSVYNIKDSDSVFNKLNEFMNSFEFSSNWKKDKFQSKGIYGYMSYDSINYFENITLENKNFGDNIPEMLYCLYENIIVVNTFNNQSTIINFSDDKNELLKIEKLITNKSTYNFSFKKQGEIKSNISDKDYLELVKKGISHCLRGDVFQIVLSRKFTQPYKGDDFNVYRKLRSINPSPYLFYFDYGNFKIFGSSPEAQLIINNKKAEIHPIAGTFKRTGDDLYDKEKAKELLSDDKENSEHMMLVDLARNDLSRSCNNVVVEKDREIQFYSHVIHLVSKVTGYLKSKSKEIIGNTFPAGTLTGAPKYKAMELINEYETSKRQFYGGAIGMIDIYGNFNHAIIIRSFLSKNQALYFQAGAGVVSKSVPENELNEVYNKVGALIKSIEKAEEK
jgi:anthranilate synthase component 1